METFELRLSLAVVALVLNGIAIGVSVEDLQAHVDADHAARLDMFTLALRLHAKLAIIPIGAAHDTNSFDLLHREGFDMLTRVTNETETPDATAIDEGDMASIGL